MSDKKPKEMKTITVTYEEFSDYEFTPPGSYYVRMATGDYLFVCTSDRKAAQVYIDTELGKGRYTIIPSKMTQPKSGDYTASGTSTRRGQSK